MTVIEKLRSMTESELVEFLCKYFECNEEHCPAVKYCYSGHTGIYDWLDSEADDEDEL